MVFVVSVDRRRLQLTANRGREAGLLAGVVQRIAVVEWVPLLQTGVVPGTTPGSPKNGACGAKRTVGSCVGDAEGHCGKEGGGSWDDEALETSTRCAQALEVGMPQPQFHLGKQAAHDVVSVDRGSAVSVGKGGKILHRLS